MAKRKKRTKEADFQPETQPATWQDDDTRAKPATDAPAPAPRPEPEQPQAAARAENDRDFWQALGKARRLANEGDLNARRAIRDCLRNSPRLRAHFGNTARSAETAFAEMMAEGDFLVAEAIRQDAAELRRALCGHNPTPLEEMAVRRLVACWQQLCYTEMLSSTKQKKDLAAAKYWLRRKELAHKLYDAAEKSLLLIRKLLPSTGPSDAAVDDRPSLPAAAPPVLAGDRTTAHGELRRTYEELIPAEGHQRPMNGHHHRLAGFLALAGPESE